MAVVFWLRSCSKDSTAASTTERSSSVWAASMSAASSASLVSKPWAVRSRSAREVCMSVSFLRSSKTFSAISISSQFFLHGFPPGLRLPVLDVLQLLLTG